MRALITSLIICALSASSACACLVADQVRRIVLGATGDTVHVLEVDVVRNGRLDKQVEWFHLTPRRIELSWTNTAPQRVVRHEWPETKATTQNEARTMLQTAYDRALAQVHRQVGFEKATLTARWQCDFMRACAPFEVDSKGLRQASRVHPVPVPALITKRTEYEGGVRLDGAGIDVVDALRIGSQTVFSVTLGWGWDQDPCAHVAAPCTDTRTRRAERVGSDLRAHIVHRRGLHHGKEWDVIVPQRPSTK